MKHNLTAINKLKTKTPAQAQGKSENCQMKCGNCLLLLVKGMPTNKCAFCKNNERKMNIAQLKMR